MKDDQLLSHLAYLKLSYFREHHQTLAKEAAEKNSTPLDFLSRLAEGETLQRKDRATQRRIQAARFPVIKTLEQFNWTWPKKINRAQVQNLFRLSFNIQFTGFKPDIGKEKEVPVGFACCRIVDLPGFNGGDTVAAALQPFDDFTDRVILKYRLNIRFFI